MDIDLQKLEELREERALGWGEVARLSGISQNTLYLIRHGRTSPLPRTIRKLAETLSVDPGELRPKRETNGGAIM